MLRGGPSGQTRDNWNTDTVKHYVRLYGWGPACQQRADSLEALDGNEERPLRYFTLCAAAAVDVFMLDRLEILPRDNATNRLRVYWCEANSAEFADIQKNVGGLGFGARLEEILLFQEDEDTQKYTLDDEPCERIRRKLILKDLNYRLHEAFPFDILNLDFCGQFFPPSAPVSSPMLGSIDRIIEWQGEAGNGSCKAFTLLLTTRVDTKGNRGAVAELTQRLSRNLEKNTAFKKLYNEAFHGLDAQSLREKNLPVFFSVALPKVITSLAMERHWRAIHESSFLYQRMNRRNRERYWMHCYVAHFERVSLHTSGVGQSRSEERIALYEEAVADIIRKECVDVNKELRVADIKKAVKADLAAIREHRDQYQAAIRNGSG